MQNLASITVGYYPTPIFTEAAIGPHRANHRQYTTLSCCRTRVIETTSSQLREITESDHTSKIQRRFGIVSRVTAAVQKSYPRIDEAARARQKIWNRIGRHYDKMIGAHPEYTDQEIEQALIKEIGNKAGKESVKSRLCRTKGGKPCNASERMK